MIIGLAILSFSPLKTGGKGEKGVYWGGAGVEHYQFNVVCHDDPLKLKNGVTTNQRSLDLPFCHTSSFSPVKTGEKGETGVHRGGTDVQHHGINVVYQYDILQLKT